LGEGRGELSGYHARRERDQAKPADANGRRLLPLLSRVVAWAVVPLYAAGMLVVTVGENVIEERNEGSYAENFSLFVGVGAFAVVGALLVAKRPTNTVGWILVSVALMLSVFPAADMYAAYTIQTRGAPDLFSVLAAWVQGWSWLLSLILILVFLPLLFPDGYLPSRRWWPVAALAGAGVAVAAVLAALSETLTLQSTGYRIENPIGIDGLGYVEELPVFVPLTVVYVVSILCAFASVVVRFRRARGVERQQMKWFVYAASPLPLFAFVDFLPELVGGLVLGAALIGMPTAIGIAVLRYRLYDIDLVINRTLVYGALTATLVLVYLTGVSAAQTALRVLTDESDQPQLAVVATTLLIAALFNPLRRRIQSFIDRRFYRTKYDSARTLERFGTRLRDETDPAALQEEVAAVVRETLQPEHVSLWLRRETR
jgi:MFS family permease